MPLIDMPLKDLMVYPGRNPRPADFDEYWDKGLAEMKSLDPQIELVPRETGSNFAECFGLYFTGVGGSRVHAKYLRPQKSTGRRHPAVLIFHGYGGDSGEWADKLNYVGQGFSVFALDCRGQAGLSQDIGGIVGNTFLGHIIRGLDDKPEKLLFRSIFLDCAQLAGIAMNMPEVDKDRVGAFGVSQGGGLTLACAALEPRIKKRRRSFRFYVITKGSGKWTWPRMPTENWSPISSKSTHYMREKTKFSRN